MNSTETTIIYQTQGILSILSRSWNLVRANLKKVLIIVAPATLMNLVLHILLSLVSSQPFLTKGNPINIGVSLLVLALTFLFSIPTLILSLFCYFTLGRYFYLAIINPQPPTIRECVIYMSKNWLPLSGLVILLGLIVTGLVVVNVVVFYLGLMLVGSIVTILAASGATNSAFLPKLMMAAFILVVGFASLAGLIALGSLEGFLFSFPITSLITAKSEQRLSIWQHISQSYQLLFRHFPAVVLFSLGLLFFSWALLIVLMGPIYLWMAIESARIHTTLHLPFYIQAIHNIWASLTNMLIMPLLASAMALFWYDCQTRSRGLDLQLWLQKLKARKSGQLQSSGEAAT